MLKIRLVLLLLHDIQQVQCAPALVCTAMRKYVTAFGLILGITSSVCGSSGSVTAAADCVL